VDRREFVGSSLAATFALALPDTSGESSSRRIGASTVTRLRNRTARLRRLDDVLGGADTYSVYAAELKATKALADEASYTSATGRGLMAVIAEQAQQAGWAASTPVGTAPHTATSRTALPPHPMQGTRC
jgi:hypothetical protein